MIRFIKENKGTITQGYAGNISPSYRTSGRKGHGAIDYDLGHKNPVISDNAGYVYKVFKPFQLKSNWTAVYMICPTDIEGQYMEICMGHLNEVHVNEGDYVEAGQVIGLQGNYGKVYSGRKGRFISIAEQKAGQTAGSHVHETYRPVQKTTEVQQGEFYLNYGKPYKDKDGFYYQVIERDNGFKGYVNPLYFSVDRENTDKKVQETAPKPEITDKKVQVTRETSGIDGMSTPDVILELIKRPDFADFKDAMVTVLEKKIVALKKKLKTEIKV